MNEKELKNIYEECMECKKMIHKDYVPQLSFDELKSVVSYANQIVKRICVDKEKRICVDKEWIENILNPFSGFETAEQIKSMIDLAACPYIETKPWDRNEFRKKYRRKMSKKLRKRIMTKACG